MVAIKNKIMQVQKTNVGTESKFTWRQLNESFIELTDWLAVVSMILIFQYFLSDFIRLSICAIFILVFPYSIL